jgi:hypothetical protein
MTRQQRRSCSKRTLKCTPSTQMYTSSRSARSRFMNTRYSSCHWVVRRVITDADSPAELPKNSANAGAKSPVDRPWRYSSGNTSLTFGLLRHHGGTIELLNFTPAPWCRGPPACRSPAAHGSRSGLPRW